MQCERCGAGPAGADHFDHCALCGARLCADCMAAGCCGQTPALGLQDGDLLEPGPIDADPLLDSGPNEDV